MMIKKPLLSNDCLEQLDTWVHAHGVLSCKQAEFLAGLWVIVEDELERTVGRELALVHERLRLPSPQ